MTNNYNEMVGYRIRQSRKKKGITMKELGKSVGLHESTISRYEKGDIDSLSTDKIKEFAKVLDVDPAYLVGWQDQPTEKERLIAKWEDAVGEIKFSDSEFQELVNYAKYIISKRKE